MENEEDAEVALQVSNALTKALLEYRMKSLEGTVSSLCVEMSVFICVFVCG